MAAGFRRGDMQSSKGRVIRKSEKVKQILGESLLGAFDAALDEQHEQERILRVMMREKCPAKDINQEYAVWLDGRENILSVVDELKDYVSDAEYDNCFDRYEDLLDCYSALENDVLRYCGTPDTSDRRQLKIKSILSQTEALEAEIAAIEDQIDRSRRQSTPKVSAPKKKEQPKSDPDFPQVSNISPVSAQTGQDDVTSTVKDREPITGDSTSAALNRLAQVLEGKQKNVGNRLPRVEPDVFKGELVQFPAWWSTFELMVERHARTEQEKLFYLHKFTSGPPNDSIKGFLSLYDDDTSYRKARNVLITRYGNRLKIADAFKHKLSTWPVVKEHDGLALQGLADFLWQCHSAMGTLEYLANLNCQEENSRIVAKLPRTTAERWDRVVDEAVYGEEPDMTAEPSGLVGRFPTFHEFCKFVAKEARILVSARGRPSGDGEHGGAGKKKATALATTARSKPADARPGSRVPAASTGCEFCQGSHKLVQCRDLLDKTSEYKRRYARERRLCYGCLGSGHIFNACTVRNPAVMRDGPMGPAPSPARGGVVAMHTGVATDGVYSSSVLPVWCFINDNPEQRFLVYAVLDSQSSGCFISEKLMELLQVEPERVSLELTTLGSTRMIRCDAVDQLRVQGQHEEEAIDLPRCYSRPLIPGQHEYIPRPEYVQKWPHLREVARELPQPRPDVSFGLLIGFNCGEALCADEYVRGQRSEPFAIKSVLGWSVSGCLASASPGPRSCFALQTAVKEVSMESVYHAFDQDFCHTEAEGRKLSQDDAKFVSIMKDGMVQREDSHFQLPLPFREEPTDLPDSRPMALRRLMSVKRKMISQPEFGRNYSSFMDKLISSGQASPVQPDNVPRGRCWYWPTHGVVHPKKPGKVRGVWDGAAEAGGVAINKLLLSGPDQKNYLVGVLARFRREKVAITCDIEGMFLQVRVAPNHRDYLRFLWFQDGNPQSPIVEYRMEVHLFGATSSPGCAGAALRETADRFEAEFGSEAADLVRDDFYVDDGLGSTRDDESAVALIQNSRGLCAAGGFNLHKYASSSRAVMEAIPAEWRAASLRDLEIGHGLMPNERTLGLLMSLESDTFLYAVQLLERPDTRRGYLSALSSVFDPLGLVSAALLPGRMLLQALCSDKLGWDQEIPEAIVGEWREWYAGLLQLNKASIPRCVRRSVELPLSRAELHTFADASSRGYGACCYLLLQDEDGRCDTTLIYAKARVAPNKTTTVPRLELQAAVLAVKMGQFMARELKYPDMKSHFWSDSMVVLGYISNEARRFHIYVANRTQFIRSHTTVRQWHHIGTEENPADMASRGITSEELVKSELWWHGPRDIREGPFPRLQHVPVSVDDPELKTKACVLATRLQLRSMSPFELLMERVSGWTMTIAVVRVWMEYLARLRRCHRDGTVVARNEAARCWLLRQAQRSAYESEVRALSGREYPQTAADCRERKDAMKRDSGLRKLDVYVDEKGLLRVGGRLTQSGWPRDLIHPIVVPGRHAVGRRIIEHYHRAVKHMGAGITLGAIRNAGIWLVGGKSAVAKMIHECVICRRHRGAVIEQRMADLPADRFDTSPPFTHVAADMFGPFQIKVGRGRVKWWICVFVCMASRAIHLEPVNRMDVSGFIQALRRFIARRGPVRTLRCDQGTNFTGASRELQNAFAGMDKEALSSELSRRSCDMLEFRFNYPKSSHMAGSWERMIRTVREAFWTTLCHHGDSLSLEVFLTLATEAEAIVNSRPLTSIDTDGTEEPHALTPSQLLTLKPEVLAPPPGKFTTEDRYSRKRWKLTQWLANQFWRRWVKDYILDQQRRPKWGTMRENLQANDIVLMVEEGSPRSAWPLARVAEVEPSIDGLVRKATVKTSTSLLKRPVQKLVFLFRPETG